MQTEGYRMIQTEYPEKKLEEVMFALTPNPFLVIAEKDQETDKEE